MTRIFARFGCNVCGASFHAQHGPTDDAAELRCESCDHAELVRVNGAPVAEMSCPKCSGTMKQGLEPQCPRCCSRDVLVLVPGMFFD